MQPDKLHYLCIIVTQMTGGKTIRSASDLHVLRRLSAPSFTVGKSAWPARESSSHFSHISNFALNRLHDSENDKTFRI